MTRPGPPTPRVVCRGGGRWGSADPHRGTGDRADAYPVPDLFVDLVELLDGGRGFLRRQVVREPGGLGRRASSAVSTWVISVFPVGEFDEQHASRHDDHNQPEEDERPAPDHHIG